MPKKKILVTGSTGQIGRSIAAIKDNYPAYQYYLLDRQAIDIGNAEQCIKVIQQIRPDYVINTAAYTAVDQAEDEIEQAMRVNCHALGYICDALTYVGGRLIHFSSDYVYGGTASSPISENAPTRPISIYGRSKLYGDQLAISSAIPTCILRTSWVYSPYGHNFVKTMLRLSTSHKELTVVNDQRGSPTYAPDLAQAAMDIITQIDRGSVELKAFDGVYHCTNQGDCTWYDFAKEIFAKSGIDIAVKPVSSDAYPSKATRPAYSVLDNTRLQWAFGLTLPSWQESLDQCLLALDRT